MSGDAGRLKPRIQIVLSREELALVDELAKQQGRSRSSMIGRIIRWATAKPAKAHARDQLPLPLQRVK
jgi:metal-responsive CopG/Arc/MetJ family transcriptional regulator